MGLFAHAYDFVSKGHLEAKKRAKERAERDDHEARMNEARKQHAKPAEFRYIVGSLSDDPEFGAAEKRLNELKQQLAKAESDWFDLQRSGASASPIRELAERLRDDPLALVSVNRDGIKKQLQDLHARTSALKLAITSQTNHLRSLKAAASDRILHDVEDQYRELLQAKANAAKALLDAEKELYRFHDECRMRDITFFPWPNVVGYISGDVLQDNNRVNHFLREVNNAFGIEPEQG